MAHISPQFVDMTMCRCARCGGSGLEKLSEILESTLAVIPRDRWVSTEHVRVRAKIDATSGFNKTTVNNRLVQLLAVELIECRLLKGRAKAWRRIK